MADSVVRTYGEYSLEENHWYITAEPHVMIKLKAVISKINKHELGTVKILNTPENCRELEWFFQRYPLKSEHTDILTKNAEKCRRTLAELERIVQPDYKPKGVYRMVKPARAYQVQSDQIFSRRGFLLNTDDIGLGKTVTGICAFTDPKKLPALVVVQPHLQKHWGNPKTGKIKEFIPELRTHIIKSNKLYELPQADIYVITYNKLHSWAETLAKFIKCVEYDEIQEIRVQDSLKYKGAKHINSHARYKQGFSGSPIYNYGDEMFNILDNLQEGCLGDRQEFYREWCEWSGRHYKIKNPKAFGAYLLEHFLMIRRTAEDVGLEILQLNKVIEEIPYDENILDKIQGNTLELAKLVMQGKFGVSGQAAMEFDVILRQQTGIAKAPYVAEMAKMILDKEQNIVLTAWHREVWNIYKEILKDYNPVFYTGKETTVRKSKAEEAFINGDSKVFCLSLRSGTGIDGLQKVCNHIIHGELDYSPKVHEQCEGRLKRDGQTKPVMSIYPIADGGSDPFVVNLLGLKDNQSFGILNPTKKDNLFTGVNIDQSRIKDLAKYYIEKYG